MDDKKSPSFLKVVDESGERRLAYVKAEGSRLPGVVYIPGFMSHKDAQKPVAVHNFCTQHGLPFVRYDPTALGESEGPVEQKDARLHHWLQDAEEVLLRLTDGPQLVIGSSMGGWISSLLAKKHPDKFHSMLLLAPSINFANYYIDKITKKVPPAVRQHLEAGGHYQSKDPRYEPYPVSLTVFKEMIPYELPLDEPDGFPVTCPVRIIHGTKDEFSPFENSLKLLKGFQSNDVQLIYVKDAQHDLDTPPALHVVFDAILKLCGLSKL